MSRRRLRSPPPYVDTRPPPMIRGGAGGPLVPPQSRAPPPPHHTYDPDDYHGPPNMHHSHHRDSYGPPGHGPPGHGPPPYHAHSGHQQGGLGLPPSLHHSHHNAPPPPHHHNPRQQLMISHHHRLTPSGGGPPSHPSLGPHPSSNQSTYKILCVTNLNYKVSDSNIREALLHEFSRYGDISVRVCHDGNERLAYVYFRCYEEAREARHDKSRLILFDRMVEIDPIYEQRHSASSAANTAPPHPSAPSSVIAPYGSSSRRRSQTPPLEYSRRGLSPPPPSSLILGSIQSSRVGGRGQLLAVSSRLNTNSRSSPYDHHPPHHTHPAAHHHNRSSVHHLSYANSSSPYDSSRSSPYHSSVHAHSSHGPPPPHVQPAPHSPHHHHNHLNRSPSSFSSSSYRRDLDRDLDRHREREIERERHRDRDLEIRERDRGRERDRIHDSISSPYGQGRGNSSSYMTETNSSYDSRSPAAYSSSSHALSLHHHPTRGHNHAHNHAQGHNHGHNHGHSLNSAASPPYAYRGSTSSLHVDTSRHHDSASHRHHLDSRGPHSGATGSDVSPTGSLTLKDREAMKREKFPNYLHHIAPEDDEKATRTLFVGNLEVSISDAELRRIFERYGTVQDVDVKRPPPGQGNAYAFIRFVNLDMAHRAKVEMSGQYIGKYQCKIGYGKATPTRRLWVGSIGASTTLQHLEEEFDRYGTIVKIEFNKGEDSAFIEYEKIESAQTASLEMRGHQMPGSDKRLRIDFAETPDSVAATNLDLDVDHDTESESRQLDNESVEPETAGNLTVDMNCNSFSIHKQVGHHHNEGRLSRESREGRESRQSRNTHDNNFDEHGDDDDEIDEDGLTISDSVTSIAELAKCCPVSWNAALVLKNSIFTSRMYLCSGDIALVDKYITVESDNSDTLPILKISQRLRLDPPKLEDVTRRMNADGIKNYSMFLILDCQLPPPTLLPQTPVPASINSNPGKRETSASSADLARSSSNDDGDANLLMSASENKHENGDTSKNMHGHENRKAQKNLCEETEPLNNGSTASTINDQTLTQDVEDSETSENKPIGEAEMEASDSANNEKDHYGKKSNNNNDLTLSNNNAKRLKSTNSDNGERTLSCANGDDATEFEIASKSSPQTQADAPASPVNDAVVASADTATAYCVTNDKVTQATTTTPFQSSSKPLKNLISYLRQKDAAGVVAFKDIDGKLLDVFMYAFPPCEYAIDLVRQAAPNLTTDPVKVQKDNFLVGLIVKGK